MWPVISSDWLKLKTFQGQGQSRALCKKQSNIETLLLQITSRKWRVTCQIVAIPMTLSDLHGPAPIADLQLFVQLCIGWQDFYWEWVLFRELVVWLTVCCCLCVLHCSCVCRWMATSAECLPSQLVIVLLAVVSRCHVSCMNDSSASEMSLLSHVFF